MTPSPSVVRPTAARIRADPRTCADLPLPGRADAWLARRLLAAYGRARLTEALREIALDTLHPGSLDLAPQPEREWLEATLAEPTRDAANAALEVLVRTLAAALDAAPPRRMAPLGEAPTWRAPGA